MSSTKAFTAATHYPDEKTHEPIEIMIKLCHNLVSTFFYIYIENCFKKEYQYTECQKECIIAK